MKAVRLFINFLCLVLIILWSAICAVTVYVAFCCSESWGHWGHRTWARVCLWLMDTQVTYVGLTAVRQYGAVILAANHESLWDVMVLAAMPYDFKWIAKKEVGHIPVIGALLKRMGSFYVSRDKSGKDVSVMKTVEQGLASGRSIVIFPEGTRSQGELLPLKKGAFRTAEQSGCPLIPVAISGARQIVPSGRLPTERRHHVVVRFGEPLPVTAGDLRASMERFRIVLGELLRKNAAANGATR